MISVRDETAEATHKVVLSELKDGIYLLERKGSIGKGEKIVMSKLNGMCHYFEEGRNCSSYSDLNYEKFSEYYRIIGIVKDFTITLERVDDLSTLDAEDD